MKKINWLLEVKKVALLMIGLTIAHLGVTFFIQADMGADPYNVLVQGVFRTVPWPESIGWTHGMTHILICLLIVLVLLVVDILQEKMSVRDALAKQSLVIRWPILYALIIAIIVFGIYGPNYDASSFIYEQF